MKPSELRNKSRSLLQRYKKWSVRHSPTRGSSLLQTPKEINYQANKLSAIFRQKMSFTKIDEVITELKTIREEQSKQSQHPGDQDLPYVHYDGGTNDYFGTASFNGRECSGYHDEQSVSSDIASQREFSRFDANMTTLFSIIESTGK